MENQVNISKSYFINKTNIKKKIERKHKKIEYYEKVKNQIIREPYKTEGGKEVMEYMDIEIERIKNKIERYTLIYFY